jgi:hypothetical protein
MTFFWHICLYYQPCSTCIWKSYISQVQVQKQGINYTNEKAQRRNVFSEMRNIKGEAHLHNFLDRIAPIGGTHTRSRTDPWKTVAMGAHLGVHPCHWLTGLAFNWRACGGSPMLVHGAFHIYHAKPTWSLYKSKGGAPPSTHTTQEPLSLHLYLFTF